MQMNIKIEGLDAVRKQLGNLSRQAEYAASRALNTTAYAVNTELKNTMRTTFAGGATAYTLRAFKVTPSHKTNLVASVALRTDMPEGGGTPYHQALEAMFTGGQRKYKRLEGWLRGRGLLPNGLMVAPGAKMPLDRFGNMRRRVLTEMLGVLGSNVHNLRVYRRTGRGKAQKAVGYFVALPGNKGGKHPGIYKRIETGTSSGVQPMVLFVKPVQYRQFIDLPALGQAVADKTFAPALNAQIAAIVGQKVTS